MTVRKAGTGHDDGRCGGTKRDGSGDRCTQWAGWGTSHPGIGRCKLHGGNTETHVKAAQVEQARRGVATLGLPRVVDAHTALLEELHRTAGAVEWLGAVVADLDRNEVAWGVTRKKTGGEDHGTTREARPSAYVVLWQQERDRLAKVAKMCVDVGIEERRVRVAEAAGQQLAAVVRAVLDRMLQALVEAIGPERAAELALQAVWAQSAVVIVPEEFRRLSTDVVAGEVTSG